MANLLCLSLKNFNGLLYPGDKNGSADEVINCRCACLQMAKWALDEDELNALKDRANYFGLDKTENFEDFKTKYLSAVDNLKNDIYNCKKEFQFNSKQFGKKIGKHAKDFGLNPSDENDRTQLNDIINNIINNPDEIRTGNWRGQ